MMGSKLSWTENQKKNVSNAFGQKLFKDVLQNEELIQEGSNVFTQHKNTFSAT